MGRGLVTLDLNWHDDAECAKVVNRDKTNFFFSTKQNERHQAKNLCFACPVRKDCIQWALESKQLWGIWGGRDEYEIRRILSVTWDGQEVRKNRFPTCPYCSAPTMKLSTKTVKRPGGGRWSTMRMVECADCGFEWQSRTSANAVDAYAAQRAEKLAKFEKEKVKRQKQAEKQAIKPTSSAPLKPADSVEN
jgi:WhiB family redox-sensing transcriptional regulator